MVFAPNFYTDKGVASVLPKRKSGIFAWCQIDSERETEKRFISSSVSKEMLAIQQLTMDWLGFDIIQKNEHLGNIYLSAPNPYFREIDISLSTNPTGIFYKILERENGFEPLKFRIIDTHGDAIAFDKTFEIEKSIDIIKLPHEPHLFELRVYDQSDDLITVKEPATFVKTWQFNLSVKQADLHVKVAAEKGAKDIIIEKFSSENSSVIGKPKEFNSEYYFRNADNKRQYIDLEQRKDFIFFPGAKDEKEKSKLKEKAKMDVRDILNHAKDTCYICDPYFGSLDIIEYAFHIQDSGVKINILNSKEYISKEEAREIVTIIKSYNSTPFSKIEVRTLRGDSILHDRFIVTDKNVWFIGSSFNEFGNRATCIARVPESSDVIIIKEIEKWYKQEEYSQSIFAYAEENENG